MIEREKKEMTVQKYTQLKMWLKGRFTDRIFHHHQKTTKWTQNVSNGPNKALEISLRLKSQF